MAELKTKKNDADVEAFLDGIENEKRRADCRAVVALMANVTGEPPAMWGDSIIGFGSYHYRYSTGREGDWMATGVSPRKQNLTVYIMTGFPRHEELMKNSAATPPGSRACTSRSWRTWTAACCRSSYGSPSRECRKGSTAGNASRRPATSRRLRGARQVRPPASGS